MGSKRPLLIFLACVLGLAVTACGSGASSTTPKSSSTPTTTSSPSSSGPVSPSTSSSAPAGSSSAAQKQVAANWVAFFSSKTPISKRVALLQDGSQFASIIKAQAGNSLASTASAKVTSVVVTSASQAAVTYDILVSGTPALSGKKGVAVKQDGTWKVGVASFCGLLALENGGKTSGLPSACSSAS
jgi:hypothetical protein